MYKRFAAGTVGSIAVLTAVIAAAPAAHADDCYEVGLERTPSVHAQLFPPQASVDDGDPYFRVNPGAC